MGETAEPETGVLAQRLDHLFKTVHPAGRGPYSHVEVATAINEAAGKKVLSSVYIWQLRKGERTNPGYRRLAALADFFGVATSYFSDDTAEQERTDDQLQLLAVLRDQGVRQLALRASGLSAPTLTAILGLVENARQLEGLTDAPEAPEAPEAES